LVLEDEPIVVVPVVPEVVVAVTPEVVVAVVSVFIVPDVSVIVPLGMAEVEVAEPIAPLSVVDIVPVVPVAAVSVDIVLLDETPVSVAAVSVFAFSSFLQPTAKMATAKRAIRVRVSFFICCFSFDDFRTFSGSELDYGGSRDETSDGRSVAGCRNHLSSQNCRRSYAERIVMFGL
jgi:hypothetical protein